MTTTEGRKNLATKNQILRQEYNRLKDKKDDIAQHLSTIIRRCKQMQALKATLRLDLQRATQVAKTQRNKKIAYINYLEGDIKKLEEDLLVQVTQLKKLQGQYQVCLQDYDNVLKIVTEQIQACRIIQSDIGLEKQNNASMKAMIFDYERLKRVLEEERKYFKELSSSEEKSHDERVKQLQKILHKLTSEQKTSQHQLKLKKFRAGMSRIHHLFRERIKKYAEHFIRQQVKFQKKKELSIKIFRNCMEFANLKHKLSTRKLFYKWHHNVFPKQSLRNLVQQAAKVDIQSKLKLSVLNKMTQTLYDKNLAIFHLYQKGKYLSIVSNKVVRKDLHYGFSKWRQNYQHKTEIYNNLSKLLSVTLPNSEKRLAFRKWKNNSSFQTRLILANHLMKEYINTRQLSRVFRKWRFQVSHYQMRAVSNFLYNMKLKYKITSRINYEKRKSKALTALAFRMTKIKLRNYFTKYWANVKSMKIQQERQSIQAQKNKFSQLRAEQKVITAKTQDKNQKISLKVVRAFMMNSRLRPAVKKWRNTMLFLRRRQEAVFHLALRKQAKTKIQVMNQFRKCVQYFEKKQMHQVLTDLNNKMQAINEKSTAFREKLKKCVEDLGIMASKKIDYLFNYSIMCQERVYFNTDLRKNVKKLYKQYVLHRFQTILNLFGEKKGFDQIHLYADDRTKDIKLEKAEKMFAKAKTKRDQQKAFYALKGMLKSNKSSFQRMGQAENIIMFYRMASAFVAIQRKNCAQKIKGINKKITNNQAVLKTKQENILNLEGQKQKLQQSLKKIFMKFVGFQDRNMILKEKRNTQMLTKRYFQTYRQNVQQKIYADKVLIHFSEFISQKNKMIFWKGANAIKYENIIALTKEELGKLNRKKKAFEQKNIKGTGDIKKRLQQAQAVHAEHLKYYNYYLKKFEDTLKFYEASHHKKEKLYYTRLIFNAWKRQYQGAKRLALGANKVLQRNLVYPGFQQIVKFVKDQNSQLKSQYLCAEILERKAKLCMKDCIMLWRCNLRKIKCQKIQRDTHQIIESREDVADECKSKGALVAQEKLRMKRKKILATCFMAFKTEVTQKVYEQRFKMKPFTEKYNERLLQTVVKGLKWLMYYKKTKRAYLKYKKQKFERQLKADVFLSLKIYRDEHYKLANRMTGVTNNIKNQHMRFALDKIINTGAYERDQLDYQRKRALRHLVMNKVTKVHLIKRKIMKKWYAWLIPRQHYLPNIMKNVQIAAMRRYFSNIKQHAYWNPVYIKKTADHITSQGYTQINTATNNLVKQGYDPQQIKQYLTKHNQKDITTIKQIVNRLKVWGNRDKLVRSWNSWRQYIVLKSKIKKSLSKVLKIAEGLGRYWNRWKSKDPQFNTILQKQSRGNMLQRYKDLGRLLKQYKRDVKDSKIYCQELKQVNDQYAEKNDQGIKMALSALSSNLKKGIRQGLQIWRTRVREHKKEMMDERYEQLSQGISLLMEQKNKLKYRLIAMREQNIQMKQKCNLGKQCGQILEKLLRERDNLSIDLADKQHNMKLLLEDNLRLKQKIRSAKQNAQKLISKVQNFENIQ